MNITPEQFAEIKKLPLYKGKVVSDSMSPIIKVGEDIVIDIGVRELKRFDIVVFYADGRLICHYLWNINRIIEPKLYRTRNIRRQLDFPIEEDLILGKVISHRVSFFWKLRFIF